MILMLQGILNSIKMIKNILFNYIKYDIAAVIGFTVAISVYPDLIHDTVCILSAAVFYFIALQIVSFRWIKILKEEDTSHKRI